MNIKRVMVAGSGMLASQIAFQTAYNGFKVSVLEINDDEIDKSKNKYDILKLNYIFDLGSTQEQVDEAFNRISFYSDMEKALEGADLVIESVPEILDVKKTFYEELSKKASEKTIFTSNSSVLIPSQIALFTDRPEKYLHLHFANKIWINNIVEIMKHDKTDRKVFEDTIEFTRRINMFPIPIEKEQKQYILNSLLVS